MQKLGIIVVLSSLTIGIVGTGWSVYESFAALELAESAGIGAIGDSLRKALFFSAGGVVGSIVGALMLILGRSKNRSARERI
jgi:hypothetical protein